MASMSCLTSGGCGAALLDSIRPIPSPLHIQTLANTTAPASLIRMSAERSNKRTRLVAPAAPAVHSASHHLSPTMFLAEEWLRDPIAFFSEEIALHIFELLSPADLGKCSCVSRLWYRLVNDQMLWRRLFLKYRFIFPRGLHMSGITARPPSLHKPKQHLKRKRSSNTVESQRQLQRSFQIAHQHQCWKALYRLNYNWIMGQARVTSVSVQELYRRDQSALESAGQALVDNGESRPMQEFGHAPIVRFKGSVILVVSPSGLVHLWRIKAPPTVDRMASGWGQPEFWQTYRCSRPTTRTLPGLEHHEPLQITCLALDTSARSSKGWQMAVVGYDSGHFSVFEYSQQDNVNSQALGSGPPSSTVHGDMGLENTTLRELGNTADLPVWSDVARIQTVSFHYPILTTCTEDGTISIYLIETESTDSPNHWCRLLHRLYGTSTGSPIEIALERIAPLANMSSACETGCHWRALVSFGLELYDSSWTVRLQEIEFDEHYILYSAEIGTDSDNAGHDSEHMDMDEAYDSPFPAYFKSSMSGSGPSSCTRSLGHARIGSISAISISWPFVVTTHSDNTMNVFQMTRKADWDIGGRHAPDSRRFFQPPNVRKGRLYFQHLSTLYGHCGAVSSVSIESRSGRLVSASMDRSIKVWSMAMENHEDQLEQKRVHRCSVSMSDINKSWTEGGQVTKEEGLGLIWVGSDEEKIVSLSCDGTVKVWQFS